VGGALLAARRNTQGEENRGRSPSTQSRHVRPSLLARRAWLASVGAAACVCQRGAVRRGRARRPVAVCLEISRRGWRPRDISAWLEGDGWGGEMAKEKKARRDQRRWHVAFSCDVWCAHFCRPRASTHSARRIPSSWAHAARRSPSSTTSTPRRSGISGAPRPLRPFAPSPLHLHPAAIRRPGGLPHRLIRACVFVLVHRFLPGPGCAPGASSSGARPAALAAPATLTPKLSRALWHQSTRNRETWVKATQGLWTRQELEA